MKISSTCGNTWLEESENLLIKKLVMQVLKFGGASVASPESFLDIADLIVDRRKQDSDVVVVVSAMANQTDYFFNLAHKVHPNPPKRELDMLVSVGERISISLLAMALALKGVEAVSFTGSQSGIITCENHSQAKIINVKPIRVLSALKEGKVAIVAGFQGVSQKGEITTLGRGGSDTTAVALAVALQASFVQFYKDVGGFYDTDPKQNSKAKLFPFLTFEQAIDLSEKGAKILHSRCLYLAQKNGIKIFISSFFSSLLKGTVIGEEETRKETIVYEAVG